MVWALLVLLGVPLWLVVGALLLALRHRRRFRRRPEAFACKLRLLSGGFDGLTSTYPRGVAYAVWVHDVLIVHYGLARARMLLLPTLSAAVATHSVSGVKGLGPEPLALTLLLDTGAEVEVAAPEGAVSVLPGPYEVAHSISSNR